MTLIAQLTFDNQPLILADLLVTQEGDVPADIGLPHHPNINHLLPGTRRISGLAQKLCLLGDRLGIAFAGNPVQARNIADVLRPVAARPNLSGEMIVHALEGIGEDWRNEVMAVGAAIVVAPDIIQRFALNVPVTALGPFGAGWIAGSGSDDFLIRLEKNFPAADSFRSGGEAKILGLGLQVSAQINGLEIFHGQNLVNAWGGGMEIAILGDRKFEKVDDILWLYWRVLRNELGSASLCLMPRIVKQNYWDDLLFLRVVEFGEGSSPTASPVLNEHHIFVSSLLRNAATYDLDAVPLPSFNSTKICTAIVADEDVRATDVDLITLTEVSPEPLDYFVMMAIGNGITRTGWRPQYIHQLTNAIKTTWDLDVRLDPPLVSPQSR